MYPEKMLELGSLTIRQLSKGFEAYVKDVFAGELIEELRSLVKDRKDKTDGTKRV